MKESTRKDAQKSTKEAMERREKTEKEEDGINYFRRATACLPHLIHLFSVHLSPSLSTLAPYTDMGSPLHPDAKRLRVSPCPARTLAIPQLIPQYTDNHYFLPPLGRHISHLVQTGYVISFPTRRPTKANYQLFFLFFVDLIYYSISRRRATQDPEGCYRLSNST